MSEENPWKTISSKLVYENPWIRVREDSVIRPDGQQGIYGVVETRIATGVVAVSSNLEVYLVGQYRYTLDEYSWEIIEGGTDDGETSRQAAERELQEEAGLAAQEWQRLGGDIHVSNCYTAEIGHLYLAQGLSEVESNPDGTEVLKLKKVPLHEALDLVHQGQIKDSLSIIGLQWAAKHLKI